MSKGTEMSVMENLKALEKHVTELILGLRVAEEISLGCICVSLGTTRRLLGKPMKIVYLKLQ
jgi:hypothetical protein